MRKNTFQLSLLEMCELKALGHYCHKKRHKLRVLHYYIAHH